MKGVAPKSVYGLLRGLRSSHLSSCVFVLLPFGAFILDVFLISLPALVLFRWLDPWQEQYIDHEKE